MNKAKKDLLAKELLRTFDISEIDIKLNYQLNKLGELNHHRVHHHIQIEELDRQLALKKQLIMVLLHAKFKLQNGEKENG